MAYITAQIKPALRLERDLADQYVRQRFSKTQLRLGDRPYFPQHESFSERLPYSLAHPRIRIYQQHMQSAQSLRDSYTTIHSCHLFPLCLRLYQIIHSTLAFRRGQSQNALNSSIQIAGLERFGEIFIYP